MITYIDILKIHMIYYIYTEFSTVFFQEQKEIVDRVVFSFCHRLRMGFAVNRHTVSHERQENRKITETFSAKSASLAEGERCCWIFTGYLVYFNG